MRTYLRIFACAGLILVSAGCNSAPHLTEYANEPSNLQDALSYSPIILVGTIAGPEAYIGPYRQSRWVLDRAFTVQLARVPVRVETILQSDREVPKGRVDIYYFLWGVEHGYDGPPRLGIWTMGDRMMFFLRHEDGYLRTIGDQRSGATTIQVFSGAHPGLRTGDPATLILDTLLSRGQGARDEQMIRAIQRAPANIAPEYYVRKLRALIAEETPAVAGAACEALKTRLDECAPSPWNFGAWQVPCNDRANMNLPCPGPCCGYGKTSPTAPGTRK
ncbi:MAG TPA: hypothetical protein VHZ07_17480 [Bryobacteraceae bacterium]|jgi:hypothetical protein|nr:hypothetical protein [Bryobacteraceae bacterium]